MWDLASVVRYRTVDPSGEILSTLRPPTGVRSMPLGGTMLSANSGTAFGADGPSRKCRNATDDRASANTAATLQASHGRRPPPDTGAASGSGFEVAAHCNS